MAKLINHIGIVLDRSGSMQSIKQAAMGAFNEQVQTLKKLKTADQEDRVSLVTFSTTVDDPIHFDAPVSDVSELATFEPDGNTALLDAVGYLIDKFKALPDANDPNTSFVITVITDGEENASRKYTPAQVSQMIKDVQATKRWTLTYLCTSTDLTKISEQLNVPIGNVCSYTPTSSGIYGASASNSAGLASYKSSRSRGATCSTGFYSGGTAAPKDSIQQALDAAKAAAEAAKNAAQGGDATK